jgi:hypothetical protein
MGSLLVVNVVPASTAELIHTAVGSPAAFRVLENHIWFRGSMRRRGCGNERVCPLPRYLVAHLSILTPYPGTVPFNTLKDRLRHANTS